MKIGTENRKELIALAVLMAILIPVVLYQFKGVFGGGNAAAAPSLPAPSSQARAAPSLPAQDDSGLRLDILNSSRKVKYQAGGRNIFTMEVVKIEPPIANVRAQNAQPYGPPAPPTPTPTPLPPPIPIKYYGYANKSGEPRKVFLQQQGAEQIFVAGQGEIVARRYRVVQITPASVTMEDVLTSNRQPIPLTAVEKPR